MNPCINVITLAVNNLQEALAFYRDGLGLPSQGIIGTEFAGSDTEPAGATAFFELQGGLILALYPRSELAKDSSMPNSRPSSVEFSIGYAVKEREEVEEILQQAVGLVQPSRTRPMTVRGGSIRVTSPISTAICGRYYGTPRCPGRIDVVTEHPHNQ